PFLGAPPVATSSPPAVSIFTTVGAVRAIAAFMAFSMPAFTSGSAAVTEEANTKPRINEARIEVMKHLGLREELGDQTLESGQHIAAVDRFIGFDQPTFL